jgi:hypothetical protein
VVYFNCETHTELFQRATSVMEACPPIYILSPGVQRVRVFSYMHTIRVEYAMDTTRAEIEEWSYSVMEMLFHWYNTGLCDAFMQRVGPGTATFTIEAAGVTHPYYVSWHIVACLVGAEGANAHREWYVRCV